MIGAVEIPAILTGLILVLVIDSLGAIASRRYGFPYASLLVLSTAVYALTGWLAGQVGTIGSAAIVGAIIGFVDSTIGWRIAWIIGPGRPESVSIELSSIVMTVFFVSSLAAAVAAVAAYAFGVSANAA